MAFLRWLNLTENKRQVETGGFKDELHNGRSFLLQNAGKHPSIVAFVICNFAPRDFLICLTKPLTAAIFQMHSPSFPNLWQRLG